MHGAEIWPSHFVCSLSSGACPTLIRPYDKRAIRGFVPCRQVFRLTAVTQQVPLGWHPPDLIGMNLLDSSPIKTAEVVMYPGKSGAIRMQ